MAGINKVILIGNLGSDPEVRRLDSGSVVAKLSLATSESYKNKQGEKVVETEWHSVNFWGSQAEICEKYLKKGSQIYVEGKIKTRKWEDKDGNIRYNTDIVGQNLTMLGKPGEQKHDTNNTESEDQSDDLPF